MRTLRLLTTLLTLCLLAPNALAQIGPDRPPVILVPGEEGQVPVHVQSLDVDVTIVGFLAETTLTMTFHNPNERILEGELVFPLPENSTISGFGLDVGGELVDGVVVEQQRARVAFEAETRVRVDPGLAEWVQGSNFRTRIYPFPANGSRTIRVSYVSDMNVAEGGANYQLPLAYLEELDRLRVRVAVSNGAAEPTVVTGGLSNFAFAAWEAQFVAETEMTEVEPDDDLVVAVPLVIDSPLVERASNGDVHFAAQLFVNDTAASAVLRQPATRVAIVYDVSGSRETADLERERALIQAWAEANPDAAIDLIGLSDRVRWIGHYAPGESRTTDLFYALAEAARDGGTDLAELSFPSSPSDLLSSAPVGDADYYLFFSDGMASMGTAERFTTEVPVITLTSSTGANHAWLRSLGEQSGGAYVNLQRATDAEALETLTALPLYASALTVTAGEIEDIELSSTQVTAGRVIVTGRLVSDNAQVAIQFRRGTDIVDTATLALTPSTTESADLVGRYWAQLRINQLALQSKYNRTALLDIGQAFNLVTPETSYIVLETLEQHIEHQIAPAASRVAMLAQYNQHVAATATATGADDTQKLERVVSDWQARVAWWNAEPRNVTDVPVVEPTPTFDGEDRMEVDEEQSVMEATEMHREMGDSPASPMMGSSTASGEGARRSRAEDSSDSGIDEESGETASVTGGSTIAVQPWNPDTPYLRALAAVSPTDAYGVYLDQKHEFGRSPAFYLDVASYLYRIERTDEARRVLTNISELELGDARLLRVVAYKLQEEGDLNLAIRLFEEVLELRPEEPQSVRDLALALAERGDNTSESDSAQGPMRDWVRAVELLDQLTRMDTGRFYAIEMPAIMEANRIIARMQRQVGEGGDMPALPLDDRLRENLELDVRVLLRWDTDETDMDLWVTEPSGERCYYGHRETATNGLYGRDYTGGYGPEEYLLRRAPDGDYLIQTNFFGSRAQVLTGGTTLQVAIFTDWGRPTEARHTSTIRLTDRGETLDIATLTLGDDVVSVRDQAAE